MSDQELITIEPKNALNIFTTENAIDPYLAKVRGEIDTFHADIATASGRKEVASMAFKVAKVKTYLEGVGKDLADEQKAIPKKIDACRKHIRDTLDAWKEEVRKPLTDWEQAEEDRVKRHENAIAAIVANSTPPQDENLTTLKALLRTVEAVQVGPECEEYEAAYTSAKAEGIERLSAAIDARQKYEADQAELAKLRQEAEERAAKDREEAIRREAAERATADAEAKAKAALDAAAAHERELERHAQESDRRAQETEARLRREADEAKAAEEAAARKREADKKHRGLINRAAVDAFVEGGIAEDTAKQVVTLIAQRVIPGISISY